MTELVRYDTAVGQLATIADACTRLSGLLDEGTLKAVYAYGRILDEPGVELPSVEVAFVLDLPAEELPWGVEPPECEGLVHLLRLDKVPIARCWRSVALPVQNQLIRRPVRIWTPEGAEADALAAFAAGQAQRLRLPAVDPDEMVARHEHELALSLGHLRAVRDRYWQDRDWRRAHSGGDRRPEDHLWEAVNGYVELLDATQ